MRIYVRPAPPAPVTRTVTVEVAKKTNLTRESTIKAVKELKRLKAAAGGTFGTGSILVSGKDLEVFDRLIDYAFNVPSSCFSGTPKRDPNTDGVGANRTGV